MNYFRSLLIEPLEDRLALATIMVTTELDLVNSGDGLTSLREAVIQSNNQTTNAGPDTITFAGSLANKPVLLLSDQITISDTVSILGLGAAQTTVNGQNASRLFDLTSAASSVTFDGLTLTGGRTTLFNDHGGAIRSAAAALNVQNSTITGNSTTGESSFGGGISAGPSTTTTVTNSTISGNSAVTGGGIFKTGGLTTGGSLMVRSSTISGNSAVSGGGIFSYSGGVQGGSVTITNSTISGNTASGSGGGMVAFMATITNSTITGNLAGFVGGLSVQSTVTIRNSIVAKNVGTGGITFPDLNEGSGGPATVQYSLIGNNNGSGLVASPVAVAPNFNLIGGSTVSAQIDPLLGPLQFNGGPTLTHRPLGGSRVIDAGNNGLAVDPAAQALLTTDQRGASFQRIVSGTVDMGAVEAVPISLVVDTDVDEADGNEGPGDLSLREAINRTNDNGGADTITFAPGFFSTPREISLGLGQLTISDNLTIVGPGASLLSVNGNLASRVFSIGDLQGAILNIVTISGLTIFRGRIGSGVGGAGIFNGENLTLERCVIRDNDSFVEGGGVRNGFPGILTVISSTISGNTAGGDGGGLANFGGTVTVLNSTISGNRSDRDGGGIFTTSISGTASLTVRNSTITNNQADRNNNATGVGGGIRFETATGTLHNTIVAGNFRSGGGGPPITISVIDDISGESGGVSADSFNNLIGTGGSGGLANGVNGNQVGVADAKLGALADNGGPTRTHALLTGSPAIDTGKNAEASPGLTTDQRGFGRIFNNTVDIGAFEVQPSIPWHNFAKPFDVNGDPNNAPDDHIVAGDALAVINYLNAFGAGPIPANAAVGQPFGFLDTSGGVNGTGDNFITAGDALDVINFLNAGLGGEGESERSHGGTSDVDTADVQPVLPSSRVSLNELIGMLAIDVASQPRRRR